MSEPQIKVSGDDGSCLCGTCHVPHYNEMLELLKLGLTPMVVVHSGDDLALGVFEPSGDQRELACHENRVIRGMYAIGVAIRTVRAATSDD